MGNYLHLTCQREDHLMEMWVPNPPGKSAVGFQYRFPSTLSEDPNKAYHGVWTCEEIEEVPADAKRTPENWREFQRVTFY